MRAPGFTAETALHGSAGCHPGALFSNRPESSVDPVFWKELWEGVKSVGTVACRAGCWAAGGTLASACTVETVGTGAPLCAAAAGAMASVCSDAC